jgi:pterin-4a-carbinolamine dehydratase
MQVQAFLGVDSDALAFIASYFLSKRHKARGFGETWEDLNAVGEEIRAMQHHPLHFHLYLRDI